MERKVSDIILQKLNDALQPSFIEVVDQSHLHAGHAGAREGGESHFHLKITAGAFSGLSRVEQQRMINDILKEELAGPVHALSMQLTAE